MAKFDVLCIGNSGIVVKDYVADNNGNVSNLWISWEVNEALKVTPNNEEEIIKIISRTDFLNIKTYELVKVN